MFGSTPGTVDLFELKPAPLTAVMGLPPAPPPEAVPIPRRMAVPGTTGWAPRPKAIGGCPALCPGKVLMPVGGGRLPWLVLATAD